jgi:phosphoadenosine phosphosulfate reductase
VTAATLDLAATAARAARELETATASEILRWAAGTFGDELAVASSMQDAVLVSLAARAKPGVDVLFLDTGYHFAETLRTRHAIAARYDVTLVTVTPRLTVAEQDARYGARLHDRDPDSCCAMRKVEPLNQALQGYSAWVTGVRRVEAPSRADTPVVSYDPRRGKVKIAPLATWSDADVEEYVAEHGILTNPLLSAGYPSIGCAPCTATVAAGGDDPRAGRWAGSAKTECGIQL